LFGVGFGEDSLLEVEVIFEADADVATGLESELAHGELMFAGAEDGEGVVIAEEFVGGCLHKIERVFVGADAAHDAEDELDEERWFDESALGKVNEVVEVAGVVAFVFKFGAVFTDSFDDVFDIFKRVAEDCVFGGA